jgi:hypothetical protein
MSEAPRVQRNCIACGHPELLVGLAGSARFITLHDRTTKRGFWRGTTYESYSLVCPNCGHVETVLKPEELALLRSKLGLDTKKPS